MDLAPSECSVILVFLQVESFCMVGDPSEGAIQGEVDQDWAFQWDFLLFTIFRRQLNTFLCVSLSSSVGSLLRISIQGCYRAGFTGGTALFWDLLIGSSYVCRDLALLDELCFICSLENWLHGYFCPSG